MPIEPPRRSVAAILSPFSDPRAPAVLALSLAALAAAFQAMPRLDPAVSELFFRAGPCGARMASRCGVFPLAHSAGWAALRQCLRLAPVVAAGLLAAALLWDRRADRLGPGFRRAAVLALASGILSSLILVDSLLKPFSGRPRPRDTDLFGGLQPFAPVLDWSGACPSNCSFVSSEAAGLFWMACLAALLPPRWRSAGFAAGFGLAFAGAGLRVAFGGHYLSDVAAAALISLLVFALVATFGSRVPARGRPAG